MSPVPFSACGAYVSYLIYFLFHPLSLSLVFAYVADGQQPISFPFPLPSLSLIVPNGTYAQQPRELLFLLANICHFALRVRPYYGRECQTTAACTCVSLSQGS